MLVQGWDRGYPDSIMKYRNKSSEQIVVLSVPGAPEKQIVIVEKQPMKMICSVACRAIIKTGDERPTPQMLTIPSD